MNAVSRAITLGPWRCLTVESAKRLVRQIRDRWPDGVGITGDDHAALVALLMRHPQAAQKIGVGVASFHVRPGPDWPVHRCFYLTRTDGTVTDFSFFECLRPETHRAKVRRALRELVADQIIMFRDGAWPAEDSALRECPVTGEPFGRDAAHVDHYPMPFEDLVRRWQDESAFPDWDIEVAPCSDNSATNVITDPIIRSSWYVYHRRHAELRLISAAGNMRGGRWRERSEA